MINSGNKCRLCGCALFDKPVLELSGMPSAAQYFPLENEFATDKGIQLNIYQCSRCGLIQLRIEPVSYYREVITAASFSEKTRATRFGQIRKVVEEYGLDGKKVLDIGTGKGDMLDVLKEAGLVPYGLEASADSVAAGLSAGRNMIKGYLGAMCSVPGGPFDMFICLNYLEHLPDPDDIIKKMYNNTVCGAVGYVTVPNVEYLLKSKCHYEFVADHLSYFAKRTLTYAFERNGFDVIECGTINEDNDIAVTVRKKKPVDIAGDYVEVGRLIRNLRDIVAGYKEKNKKVAVWGAGHRTLALLALSGLDTIEYVIDSAKFKQGRFTPILHRKIVSPETLRSEKVDLVIVMVPGLYPGEVLKTLHGMNTGVDIAVLKGNNIEFIK
ncbi:MAG TPA: methyltransferase domain-containing protein [Candidatus Omnitrophota bacterium]|nr:methyltransferase domain-containing protein [Candidatus Omnitrophota bacterium]